jgi:homoserine O-succinyltransferase/O-acetyltransferase
MPTRDNIGKGQRDLVVGLVNNMSKAACRTTEMQFQHLLDLASRRQGVRVKLLALPACAPSDQDGTLTCMPEPNLAALRESRLDGMIVTGSEPKADAITDEPMWPAMARLVDWANENTISTVWSCLAGHVAVYHMDGLSRQRLPTKLSGVFDCTKASDHYLVRDLPPRWTVPHSRHNGLDEATLTRKGYQVLSHSPRVGPDMVVKKNKSLFVILQGHPEYGAESLSREYWRDVRRFLTEQRESYPEIPESYFDQHTTTTLNALREQATRQRDPVLLAARDTTVNAVATPSWGEAAVSLYARWLSYLAEHGPQTAALPGKAYLPGRAY